MEIIGNDVLYAEVLEKGAYVKNIYFDGKCILKESTDGEQTHGGMQLLIPYADRVQKATYNFSGKRYHLPRNSSLEGDIHSSIHGILREKICKVKERKTNKITFETDIVDTGMPSKLKVLVTYKAGESLFDTKIRVINAGKHLVPVVVGAHPYFLIRGKYTINHTDPIKKLYYPDGVFPDGSLLPAELNSFADLSTQTIDDSFHGGGALSLKSDYSHIVLTRTNMNYFEVYNGTYARPNSVALEPMTGAINAFNNKIGLKVLPRDKSLICSFRIDIL